MTKEKCKLVSVCIPVYNNEAYVVRTIESVVNQTYKNIEIVIVDDSSSDNSYETVKDEIKKLLSSGKIQKAFELSDCMLVYSQDTEKLNAPAQIDFDASGIPRLGPQASKTVCLYRNSANLGMSGNWNRCMELCRGDFIKLICADDQIDTKLIEEEVRVMDENPDVLLVESDTVFVDKNNKKSGKYPRYGEGLMEGKTIARKSIMRRDFFGAPLANLIRTSAYKQYGGFDSEFNYIVDYDFFMKLACNGKIYVIREPLNFFCLREDSNTGEVLGGNKGKKYTEEHVKLVYKYAQDLNLSNLQIKISIVARKTLNLLGGIYLKLRVRS